MKTLLSFVATLAIAMLAVCPIFAQSTTSSAPWSGQLTYEGIHKIDPASLKFLDDNGELMKPSDPNFPKDIPDNRMSEQKVLINGSYAKVTGNNYQVMPTIGKLRPFVEQVFIDLKALKKMTLLTVGRDAEAKFYQAETPLQRVSGWQFTEQTKKIAGYTCRKATVPYKKETFTVWITTELPFTYSPIQELTPETGTVLLIEGSKEQFKATKVTKTAVDASVMKPNVQAQHVTLEQLGELRQKAIADFTEKYRRVGQGG
jgi:GLPGLI family protein